MLVKASQFAAGLVLQYVPCVVCDEVPPTDWTALAFDPVNTGLHCSAHKVDFHSVCACNYNCCEDQYDPDRDYEFRHLDETQE